MGRFIWHYGEPPEDMIVRQVYAIAFDNTGRMLLKADMVDGNLCFGMFGGTPESFDKDRIDTLRREYIEEANTTLSDPIYLVGYQEVEGDGDRPNYAQIRMVAMIDKIGPKQPDPDNGEIHGRLLTTPKKAIKLLNWGDHAEKQIMCALKIAQEKFNLRSINNNDEWV